MIQSKQGLQKDMQIKAIVNAKLILNNKMVEGKTLLFDDKIIEISDSPNLNNCEIIDANGMYVSAGFIDLHIHGSGGADIMDSTFKALESISLTLLQTGTTSFLATTMTMSKEDIDSALQNVKMNRQDISGAKILGVHLEGPFINPSKHGAQDKQYIQKPNLELIHNYLDIVKMITLAPEIEGAKAFIKQLKKEYPHILLSIGHSDASFEKTKKSFSWGITHATHLFNAMNPYHHREPGIVGAVFDTKEVSCDVIADLIHTHPAALDLVYKIKQNNLVLITDAMRAGCMKSGVYDLGGRKVVVSNAEATLSDGTLAGSVLKLNKALFNMVKYTSMTRIDAINAVTKIPAEKLGLNKGQLLAGYDADIVVFDEDFSIISTIVAGKVKYKRG